MQLLAKYSVSKDQQTQFGGTGNNNIINSKVHQGRFIQSQVCDTNAVDE